MNNIERIFEAVCNILSVYVSFKVTDVFLEKKRKLPRMANIVYVLVWLINTVVAFGFRNAMGTTVSMVLLLWAAEGILYEGSILQKIMAGCFTVLLGLTIPSFIKICLQKIHMVFHVMPQRIQLFLILLHDMHLLLIDHHMFL